MAGARPARVLVTFTCLMRACGGGWALACMLYARAWPTHADQLVAWTARTGQAVAPVYRPVHGWHRGCTVGWDGMCNGAGVCARGKG